MSLDVFSTSADKKGAINKRRPSPVVEHQTRANRRNAIVQRQTAKTILFLS